MVSEIIKLGRILRGSSTPSRLSNEDKNAFIGKDETGADIVITKTKDGGSMVKTYKNDGWIRFTKYDKHGDLEEEYLDGKWKKYTF